MIPLAVLLASVGAADVAPRWRLTIGVLTAVAGGWALGCGWHTVWITAICSAVLLFWLDELKLPAQLASDRSALPALVLAAIALIIASPLAVASAAPISDWYGQLPIRRLESVSLERAALALGVMLFLGTAANKVVQRAISAVGPSVLQEQRQLRGGALLGPLERWLVFAFAVSGQLGALGALVAAKGILRYPEVSQDKPDGMRAEYVLVGSFVSWTLALVFVPLL